MKTHNGKKCVPREYARRQESVEPDLKILLAKAALQQMRDLRDGEGLVVDAGSSCLAFFKEYAEMIRNEHKYLSFYTNSYQILECWLSLPDGLINEIPLEILGSKLDCMHLAFHGDVAKVMLNPRVFKPAVVVIGASGIMFDSEEGLLFSYHASSPEEKFKQLLFQCVATKKRIILGTASKIGFVGAYSFDLLSSDMFDTRTPICLITTAPRKDDTETAERFYKMREVFYSRDMQDRVQTFAPGLNFEWIVLDPEKGDRMFDEFDKEKRPVAATPSSNGCRP